MGCVIVLCVRVFGWINLTDLPPHSNHHKKKQIKYLNETTMAGSSSHQQHQDGQEAAAKTCVTFRLLNLRDEYAFALLRGGLEAPVRAVIVPVLDDEGPWSCMTESHNSNSKSCGGHKHR